MGNITSAVTISFYSLVQTISICVDASYSITIYCFQFGKFLWVEQITFPLSSGRILNAFGFILGSVPYGRRTLLSVVVIWQSFWQFFNCSVVLLDLFTSSLFISRQPYFFFLLEDFIKTYNKKEFR